MTCSNCEVRGHVAFDCEQPRQQNSGNNRGQQPNDKGNNGGQQRSSGNGNQSPRQNGGGSSGNQQRNGGTCFLCGQRDHRVADCQVRRSVLQMAGGVRLSCILLAATVTFLASCDVASAASASEHTQLSRMTIAEDSISSVGVVENDIPTKRRLRAATDIDEDEERMFEGLKLLPPWNKIVSKDGKTFSGHFVKNLLSSESARDKVFKRWYQSEIDEAALKGMLGDMNKKGLTELLNKYTSFLSTPDGLLHHNAGLLFKEK